MSVNVVNEEDVAYGFVDDECISIVLGIPNKK